MLFSLKNRALRYDRKSIRANAVKPGNVIVVDGGYHPVLAVDSSRMIGADDESEQVLAKIRQVAAEDKVSPNFDDAIKITIGVASLDTHDPDGGGLKATAIEKVLFFAEWEIVNILV